MSFEQSIDDIFGSDLFGFCFVIGEDPVREDFFCEGAYVFDFDRIAALEDGAGFGSEDEVLGSARSSAPSEVLFGEGMGFFGVGAGGADESDSGAGGVIGDGDAANEILEGADLVGVEEFLDVGFVVAGGAADDLFFFGCAGITDADLEHKAVELGFGEGIGAFLFDGVLGGHDKEGEIEGVGFSAGGDAVFLHGLEESGLGFGGSAVDLVGEKEVTEDRPTHEMQAAFSCAVVFFEDLGACDIGGHEVGSELDAVEGEVEDLGESGDQEGFGETGDTDDQGVSARKESNEQRLDHMVLSDDAFVELGVDLSVDGMEFLDLFEVFFGIERGRG